MFRRRLQRFVFGLAAGVIGGAVVLLDEMANYEDKLFDQIVAGTIKPDWSEKQKVTALNSATYDILLSRRRVFFNKEYVGLRDRWFPSGDVSLLDARGACGSHTQVLGRLLDRAGIDFRVAQMYCAQSDTWGCHITVEAKADGKWIAVDPLYNLVFPASYEEVGRNWETYKALTPLGYNSEYAYTAVRYTNWGKIPVILPAAKRTLDVVAPEFARTFSARSYMLNLYRVYELALLSAALAGICLGLVRRRFVAAPEEA